MTQARDVRNFNRVALVVGLILTLILSLTSGSDMNGWNQLWLGGVSALGLIAYCWAVDGLIRMVED